MSLRKITALPDERILGEHGADTSVGGSDVFMHWLTHELRSPLTSLLAWTQLLRLEKVPEEKKGDALATIEKSAKTLQHLIDEVADFVEIRNKSVILHSSRQDWNELAREACNSVAALARQRQVLIEPTLPAERIDVRIDQERFARSLHTLLVDVVKRAPKDAMIRITTGFRYQSAYLRIECVGFAPFPFADDRCLGLSITNALLEMHGGGVLVDDLAGEARQDSTFELVTPLDLQ